METCKAVTTCECEFELKRRLSSVRLKHILNIQWLWMTEWGFNWCILDVFEVQGLGFSLSFTDLIGWHQLGWSCVPKIYRSLREPQFWGRPFLAAGSIHHNKRGKHVRMDSGGSRGLIWMNSHTGTFIIFFKFLYRHEPSQKQKAPRSTLGWCRWVWWTTWYDISSLGRPAARWPPPPLLFSRSSRTETGLNISGEMGDSG